MNYIDTMPDLYFYGVLAILLLLVNCWSPPCAPR
jgi:hypothetical protein